jgi:hypothetical protein
MLVLFDKNKLFRKNYPTFAQVNEAKEKGTEAFPSLIS